MKLGRAVVTASAGLVLSTAAVAADIAPDDVALKDYTVSVSLTGVSGRPAEGAKVFVDRKLGNCLACHQNSATKREPFRGNVGPSLDAVADAKQVIGADTIMPGFYSLHVGASTRRDLVGETILTSQQIEDVVVYLSTLK